MENPKQSLLNDFSATIGAEVAQAEQIIRANPSKFVGWTWKSDKPEFLYVSHSQGNSVTVTKFHFFLFDGKVSQTKTTSDKVYYKLTDGVIASLSAPPKGQATSSVPVEVKQLSK